MIIWNSIKDTFPVLIPDDAMTKVVGKVYATSQPCLIWNKTRQAHPAYYMTYHTNHPNGCWLTIDDCTVMNPTHWTELNEPQDA